MVELKLDGTCKDYLRWPGESIAIRHVCKQIQFRSGGHDNVLLLRICFLDNFKKVSPYSASLGELKPTVMCFPLWEPFLGDLSSSSMPGSPLPVVDARESAETA